MHKVQRLNLSPEIQDFLDISERELNSKLILLNSSEEKRKAAGDAWKAMSRT
jgi:hypothetical protein